MEITELPEFEIVVDQDDYIREVYQNGEPLSSVLPSLTGAKAVIDCSDEPNKIEIVCYGTTRITYRES